jgi:hypothetical protein
MSGMNVDMSQLQLPAPVAPNAQLQQPPQAAQQQMPQQAPQQPNPSQIMQQLQQISQTPLQPVPQAGPDQGASPVKRFLTNFFYGAGQSALQHVGLPTDYEKQQNVIQQNQRQQQLNQQAGETSSLIGLHQQQLQNEQQTYAQNQYQNQQLPIPAEVAQHFPGQVTARRADIIPMLNAGSALNQKMPMDVDDDIADILKLPRGTQVDPRMIPILSKMAALNPAAWQTKDAGGILQRVNKFTGEIQPVLGSDGKPVRSNSMLSPIVRAQANAAYTPFQTTDTQGNPTTISNQQALNTGAPKTTEQQSMNLASDKTGVSQFLDNNEFFRKNMGVLDDMTQRGLIARATTEAEGNPGATQSVLNSYIQKGMTPQSAEFASRLLNQREMSGVLRKYTGNGGSATDSLRAIVNSNLPGASRSSALNNALLDRDQQLATGVLKNLGRPTAYAPKARQTTAPAQQSGAPAPAAGGGFSWSQFGGQQR